MSSRRVELIEDCRSGISRQWAAKEESELILHLFFPPQVTKQACRISMFEQIFALLTCSDQTRSAEAVQERLDRLIGEIYKLQTPHMDGKSGQPADVLIVRTPSLLFPLMSRL